MMQHRAQVSRELRRVLPHFHTYSSELDPITMAMCDATVADPLTSLSIASPTPCVHKQVGCYTHPPCPCHWPPDPLQPCALRLLQTLPPPHAAPLPLTSFLNPCIHVQCSCWTHPAHVLMRPSRHQDRWGHGQGEQRRLRVRQLTLCAPLSLDGCVRARFPLQRLLTC